MQRLGFIMVIISVLIGISMPGRRSSTAEVNQSVLIDSGSSFSHDGGDSADVSEGPARRAYDRASTTISPSYGGEVTLDRSSNGHFYTQASVNGQSLPFVVDTGASSVALTVESARQIGLYVDPSSFKTVGQGASGDTRGMFVTLDRVEVAGRTVEHVDAVVLEGLGTNLLGQSVLTRLGGVQMSGDKMVLR